MNAELNLGIELCRHEWDILPAIRYVPGPSWCLALRWLCFGCWIGSAT